MAVAKENEDELVRLLKILLTRTDSLFFAKTVGWVRPISVEAFAVASLYTAWTGAKHPMLPDVEDKQVADIDIQLADMALENMNKR